MPTLRGGVVVKMSRVSHEDRDMLENEADIYDKFPGELQECNPSSPPIVPKFYGYYVPSLESIFPCYHVDDENELAASTLQKAVLRLILCLSPILLLEYCGQAIRSNKLSTSDWCEDFPPITFP